MFEFPSPLGFCNWYYQYLFLYPNERLMYIYIYTNIVHLTLYFLWHQSSWWIETHAWEEGCTKSCSLDTSITHIYIYIHKFMCQQVAWLVHNSCKPPRLRLYRMKRLLIQSRRRARTWLHCWRSLTNMHCWRMTNQASETFLIYISVGSQRLFVYMQAKIGISFNPHGGLQVPLKNHLTSSI